MENSVVRTQIRLPKSLYEALRGKSEKSGASLNQTMIRAIQQSISCNAPAASKLDEALRLLNTIKESSYV
jgi:predicted HicB family RNase H-like nuclease